MNDVIGVLVNLERSDKAVTDFTNLSKRLRSRLHLPDDED